MTRNGPKRRFFREYHFSHKDSHIVPHFEGHVKLNMMMLPNCIEIQ